MVYAVRRESKWDNKMKEGDITRVSVSMTSAYVM